LLKEGTGCPILLAMYDLASARLMYLSWIVIELD
jgi:hypothetical protein